MHMHGAPMGFKKQITQNWWSACWGQKWHLEWVESSCVDLILGRWQHAHELHSAADTVDFHYCVNRNHAAPRVRHQAPQQRYVAPAVCAGKDISRHEVQGSHLSGRAINHWHTSKWAGSLVPTQHKSILDAVLSSMQAEATIRRSAIQCLLQSTITIFPNIGSLKMQLLKDSATSAKPDAACRGCPEEMRG